MEREFDAYKLSRCMCPSNYNRFWDRARYLWKNHHFIIPPLHSTPPLGEFLSEYRHPLWDEKTRMVSLPDGEKISKTCLFVLMWSTNVTDGRTDGQTLRDSKDRAYASHRAVKIKIKAAQNKETQQHKWMTLSTTDNQNTSSWLPFSVHVSS